MLKEEEKDNFGKGDVKGGGKGKGGKGPCWTCGGEHNAINCPKNWKNQNRRVNGVEGSKTPIYIGNQGGIKKNLCGSS